MHTTCDHIKEYWIVLSHVIPDMYPQFRDLVLEDWDYWQNSYDYHGWDIKNIKPESNVPPCGRCLGNGTIPCYSGTQSITKCRQCKGTGDK